MRKFACALVFLFFLSPLFGQLTDDFSDGNFESAPVWEGDADNFSVINGMLQLNDVDAGSSNRSVLYTLAPTGISADTEWRFKFTMDFSPSASNFAQVYLNAAGTDISSADAYFLKIGGISGSEDAIEMYVRQQGQSRLLLSGTPGAVASGPVLVSIRVNRSSAGVWELWADYNGGTDYQLEGSVNDQTLSQGSYFALECLYTSTRGMAFSFDDLLIDPIVVDETAPVLISAGAIEAKRVKLQFDEPLADKAWPAENFIIDQGIGSPESVLPVVGDLLSLELGLTNSLQPGIQYNLTVTGIEDRNGNSSLQQATAFVYLPVEAAAFRDVIISEIFADPSPSLGLPEFEFVELYNRSAKYIDLGQLQISSGGTPQEIESLVMAPGAYVIVCDEDAAEFFASFGTVVRVTNFPSLTNGGDEIQILDRQDNEIISVSYDLSWYKAPEKQSGGYTMELVDLSADPGCSGNWYGSLASIGGTPGEPNSWLGQSPDQTGPVLLGAFAESSFEVILTFDEPLSGIDTGLEKFAADPSLTIIDAQPVSGNANQVLLTFDQDFEPGTKYQIITSSDILDCLGNQPTEDQIASFGIAEPPLALDLVINELLFHPQTGGEDFVELFNRSGKIINLRDFQLINSTKESGNRSQSIKTDHLIFPGEYVVITDIPADILDRYSTGGIATFIEQDLPTLDARAGNITLQYGGIQIDAFNYEDSFHFPLLREERGVSLERIDSELPTQTPDNWQSAASTVGFATPGLPNSQIRRPGASSSPLDGIIMLYEKTISPDGDGFQDVLIIEYETPGPGYLLNASIFDLEGRQIRVLANNELLASRGNLKWDGTTGEGNKARIGIYLIWFEIFDAQGNIMAAKEPIVVAGQLK